MRRILPALLLVTGCATAQIAADLESSQRGMRAHVITMRPDTVRPEFRQDVIDGRVAVGMTQGEVELAWGNVYTTNRTTTASGIQEQWVFTDYRDGRPRVRYVYVENGRVVAVQD